MASQKHREFVGWLIVVACLVAIRPLSFATTFSLLTKRSVFMLFVFLGMGIGNKSNFMVGPKTHALTSQPPKREELHLELQNLFITQHFV